MKMIGFNTDAPVIPPEELFLQAGIAVRYGFDATNLETVRGLTIVPATTAGIANRVGSLEPGKDADFVIMSGDPADPRTAVSRVFINGKRVYDTAKDKRRF
jgi:imidazolonepropionase-like amidohydrolase